ncbi:response regulator transcription factor [Pedobacter xixiisoli]|uniref:DNA-binding response regulator, OmpR family, contains REC and winged-helix (WHTH) domain n=1 Tax=Pedobacter xixiisoli TaxID=1476464 RepID=A0A285ZYR1_9SPHI|nr:response regulator transcription factor [Pedobacter xixiisoli]SOD14783.1 DNA-binding response regulator, OmpR family, contains REC and winged-helix (wHTH) domain [Pedobacter xixiisoli]
MPNHILLVEDDLDLGLVLKQYLEFSGFAVTWFSNPLEALQNLPKVHNIQLAIIDVMMPEMNGFDLSKAISEQTKIPFLFLTAKAQSIDRILGLKLGADDYIAKPCEPEELLLRVKNILKREQKSELTQSISIGNYSFLPSQYQIVFKDKTYTITEKETELLILLSQNNHKVVNRKEILEKLWGENDYFLGRSLDVFMTRLRKYFKEDERIKFDSVRGIGFKVDFPE